MTQTKPTAPNVIPLGHGARGLTGVVVEVGADIDTRGVDPAELERRLLEMGFVEGAKIEILHEGLIGGDPIAVRLDDTTRVALRRREADSVLVSVTSGGAR